MLERSLDGFPHLSLPGASCIGNFALRKRDLSMAVTAVCHRGLWDSGEGLKNPPSDSGIGKNLKYSIPWVAE